MAVNKPGSKPDPKPHPHDKGGDAKGDFPKISGAVIKNVEKFTKGGEPKGDPRKITGAVIKDLDKLAKAPKPEEEVKTLQHLQAQIKSNSSAYTRKYYERMNDDLEEMIQKAKKGDQKGLM